MKLTRRFSSALRMAALCLCLTAFAAWGSGSALAAGPDDASSAGSEEPSAAAVSAAPETAELPFQADEPDGEIPPTPEYTVTFSMGKFGTRSITLYEYQYPSAQDVPEIPELPLARVLGWYDRGGNRVDPRSVAVTADTTYFARWGREVGDLLNTQEHLSYVSGSDHLFHPDNGLTRAEAAQLFYALLRTKDVPQGSFPDVAPTAWYAPAVNAMAGLGIVSGQDGRYQPQRAITRAEFVTIAVGFDTLLEGPGPSFPDVPTASWAYPYITTAAAKGWISGFTDGLFHPGSIITRAEAVTIINKMLGRSPDSRVKTLQHLPQFYDLNPTHWAYGQIMEAATQHQHRADGAGEVWTGYTEYPELERGKFIRDGEKLFYVDPATGKFARGDRDINGVHYYFDPATGAGYTGLHIYGAYRWYFQNGVQQKKDISGLGVVSGPYCVKVYKNANYLVVFARGEDGVYNIPVKAMRTSCGVNTPTGTYYTPAKYRWLQMVGNTWAQWCTQIYGDYLFHSVPNWTQNNLDLEVEEYNHLGETRSMGCIRLNCRDAKWIFDNCSLGMKVEISSWETVGPLPKPDGLQIPSWHSWDPTDPTAAWKCREIGCH